jgi:glycosyltransferase involved in cell wall biosynthesis
MTDLRVQLLAPAVPPSARGNARSVARLDDGFLRAGIATEVCQLSACAAILEKNLREAASNTVTHFFHMTQAFAAVERCGYPLTSPYVISQTGTDLAEPVLRTPAFLRFMLNASRIVVYQDIAKQTLLSYYPELRPERVVTVLKAIDLPAVAASLPAAVDAALRQRFVVLLPAHLRPIKRVELALVAMLELARTLPRHPVTLLIAGGILDHEYASRLHLKQQLQVVQTELSREQMVTAFLRASLVVNTSTIESSPNAVLEALYLGRTVASADIPGVRGIYQSACSRLNTEVPLRLGESPVLFYDIGAKPPSLAQTIQACLADPAALTRSHELAKTAFAYLGDGARESAAYVAIYRDILAERDRAAVR